MPSTGAGSARAQATLAFLRRKIVSGEWPVGSRIPTEPELMELLGVGRTTVREAVRSLASLGMLEALVSRGTYVRSRMPVSGVLADFVAEFGLDDVLGFRRALEVEAARTAAAHRTDDDLAALRAALAADAPGDSPGGVPGDRGSDDRQRTPGAFHHLLVEATGNPLTSSLYAGVMARLRDAMGRGEVVYGASAEDRRAEHAAILAAVEAGDVTRAAAAMAEHSDHDLAVVGRADASA